MKITKSRLQQIIQEELQKTVDITGPYAKVIGTTLTNILESEMTAEAIEIYCDRIDNRLFLVRYEDVDDVTQNILEQVMQMLKPVIESIITKTMRNSVA